MTCKRFRELGQTKVVLAKASPWCLSIRAQSWSDSAHRFLQRCADAGNLDTSYLLGMIRFYCLGGRGSGAALMAAAAVGGHREALYSLAVIQFNGSGGIGVQVGVAGVQPPVHGRALRLVRHIPVQRLARARAVVHHAAHGAPPELVPPHLRPPTQRVRAQPQTAVLLHRHCGPLPPPLSAPSGRDTNHSDRNRLAACASTAAAAVAARHPKSLSRQECRREALPSPPRRRAEQRCRRGDRGRELPCVGLDEEAAPVEQRPRLALKKFQP